MIEPTFKLNELTVLSLKPGDVLLVKLSNPDEDARQSLGKMLEEVLPKGVSAIVSTLQTEVSVIRKEDNDN